DLVGREFWGDLKYVGVCLLPAAYLAFVLQCSGHTRWPRWLGPGAATPAPPALVPHYPAGAPATTPQAAEAGPLFWPHLLYNNALVWGATVLLVGTLGRVWALYRRRER